MRLLLLVGFRPLPVKFDHDWCGVTQLGWDEESEHKIAQMLSMDLPAELAVAVEANAVEQITGVATNCSGITYPQGGWLCPAELTRNVLELAQQQGLQIYYQYQLQNLSRKDDCWLLNFAGDQRATHSVVVLANGHQISRFTPNVGSFRCIRLPAGQPYSDNAGTGRAEAGAVL